MGLGLGAQKIFLKKDTTFLPVGHFWCEWFEGAHHSVDYWPKFGAKAFTIQGLTIYHPGLGTSTPTGPHK